ncbi:HpcH/HpaI aldolase/citrate lyase family protein [Cupriavidus necator]
MFSGRTESLRSLLFVPADSERKLNAALRSSADALVFDLEDPVAEEEKGLARERLGRFLKARRGQIGAAVCVRINALNTEHILRDLQAVVPHAPDAVVLPKCKGISDVYRLCDFLEALEQVYFDGRHKTEVIAMATESAAGVLGLASYANPPLRLSALMWGVADLAADIGALQAVSAGTFTPPFSVARTLCLLAAAQAGVQAIDAVSTDLSSDGQIEAEALLAKRDGFSAKAAAHPSHIASINRVFEPQPEEVAWARGVVDAFDKARHAGVVRFGGAMLDRPHLRLAHRILNRIDGND